MSKKIAGFAVAFAVLVVSLNAAAATRYISDELSVNMRRGPSTSYGINDLLKAGTQVQTLDESNGWTKIRTPGGEQGYVLTRFLSSQPAARNRIEKIATEHEKLVKENKALHAELAEALNGSKELGKLKSQLVSENKALKAQLEKIKQVSANAMQINQQNQQYRKKLLVLESKVERLQSQNKALQSRREGMKIGALILIVGIIVGLIVPLFRRRRKGSWDSL